MSLRHPAYRYDEWLWPVTVFAPLGTAAGVVVLWWLDGTTAWPLMLLLALVMAGVVSCFARFRIELDAHTLRWHFGLLGWPSWQVAMAEIVGVEPARASWLEGAGSRRTRDGMLYRAIADTTVRLTLRDGRRIRLGTNEPQRLIAFIEPRLSRPARR